ncbi:hypothetical protein [Halalkalibacillus halophilus]|uniref:hypothetical protein n=1 Tax=Halalkalibacillus halophilus TaxID=392827 RepID=UPI00042A5565|nr:hypothetical protein [Halalkalibacillus halophilus]
MKQFLYQLTVLAVIIALPLTYVSANSTSEQLNAQTNNSHQFQLQNKNVQALSLMQVEVNEEEQLSHEQIVNVTNEFMDLLVQDTNDQYQVTNYDTLEELKEAFDTVADRAITDEYVDFFYKEEEDGLYIVPTQTPPWFDESVDYEVTDLGNQTYQVTQSNETDLYGDYTINLEIELNDNNDAIIMGVQYQ